MRSRFITTSAALVVAAALLAGCSSGGGTSSSAVDTKPDGTGKTLTLWDYEGDTSAMGIAWKAAISEFEKETGAKVKFEAKSFQQIQSTASQVLNSNSAPDIMEYNKGNATAGLLSSEGLLTNLDAAVKAYGWDKDLSSSLLDHENQREPDGGFRGRDRDREDRDHHARRRRRLRAKTPEGDEIQSRCREHHLDADENENRVPPT